MARILITIYFDYASTLCYIAWRIVRELELELDFEPLWKGVPIRWRSHSSSPGQVLGTVEQAKIAMVIAETGVQVTPPKHWIDSDAALMGSELARQAGVFEHRADLHSELLLTVAATPQAETNALGGVGLHLGDAIHTAAMRAYRTFRPDTGFYVIVGGLFVVEVLGGKGRHWVNSDCGVTLRSQIGYVKYNYAQE